MQASAREEKIGCLEKREWNIGRKRGAGETREDGKVGRPEVEGWVKVIRSSFSFLNFVP